jgi:hypothetical protein
VRWTNSTALNVLVIVLVHNPHQDPQPSEDTFCRFFDACSWVGVVGHAGSVSGPTAGHAGSVSHDRERQVLALLQGGQRHTIKEMLSSDEYLAEL